MPPIFKALATIAAWVLFIIRFVWSSDNLCVYEYCPGSGGIRRATANAASR